MKNIKGLFALIGIVALFVLVGYPVSSAVNQHVFIDGSNSLSVQIVPFNYYKLTSVSPTACTSVFTGTSNGLAFTNTGPNMVVFFQFYDEGAAPTCAAADVIYGDNTTTNLSQGQIVKLPIPTKLGLAYKLSGALSSNFEITQF